MFTTEQMDRAAVVALDMNAVVRVYSGKPGCGCGCRGKYWEDARNIKRVVHLMKSLAQDPNSNAERVGYDAEYGTAFVETDTRYFWAYTMKETDQ